MCKVIDFTSKLIKEDEIYWSISIESNTNERMSIMRNPANDGIMIYLTTNSFDRIEALRQKALKELKQQLLKNEVEYV
ncbi:hypothetical protein [Gemmiger formicilis]